MWCTKKESIKFITQDEIYSFSFLTQMNIGLYNIYMVSKHGKYIHGK